MPRLVFIDENFSGQAYELVLEKTSVGRGNHNTLVIHDDSVSSTHCEILVHGPEVIVRDLDSRNGTFVEGLRLNKQAQVKAGQLVRFGTVAARLELDPEATDSDGTEITAVYELSQIMRQKRREAKKPKPPAHQQVEPTTPSAAPGEQTIIMPRPSRVQHAAPPAPPQAAPVAGRSKTRLVVVLVLVALGIALLVWLLAGR